VKRPPNWKRQNNVKTLAVVLQRRLSLSNFELLHYQVDAALYEAGLKPVKLTVAEKAARKAEVTNPS
jgi:hypothetical protein